MSTEQSSSCPCSASPDSRRRRRRGRPEGEGDRSTRSHCPCFRQRRTSSFSFSSLSFLFLIFLLYCLLLLPPATQAQPAASSSSSSSSWQLTYDLTYKMVSNTMGWVYETIGVADVCPFATEFSEVAKRAVHSKIRCQERALDVITSGLSHWELDLMRNFPHPLVFAFTGPTGVGKTETAHVLARAMLTKTELVGTGKRPRGLLVLRGEDFGDPRGNVSTYVDTIKHTLYNHVQRCQGQGVVIFDEIQKVIPGTLEALAEAISEQPTLTILKDGIVQRVDTSHVAFFLISDIGWEDMLNLIVRYNGSAEAVPPHVLARRVKDALDKQWERLRFGKLVDKVVPFLPLNETQMRQILDLKLEEMSNEHRSKLWSRLETSPARKNKLWSRLETTPEVRDYLVKSPFVKYAGYRLEGTGSSTSKKGPASGSSSSSSSSNSNSNSGGQQQQQQQQQQQGGGKGEGSKKNETCASSTGKDEGIYWFAEFGARNLHIGGPIQALESAIVEHMKPWRPLEELDVRYNPSTQFVELRWCPEAFEFKSTTDKAGSGCELRWAGNLKNRIG